MHRFEVQSSISQFQPLVGKLSGSSGALDTVFSLPAVWGGIPEATGTGELLAGAAAACYLITTQLAASREGIKLSRLEVRVEGDMTADSAGANQRRTSTKHPANVASPPSALPNMTRTT